MATFSLASDSELETRALAATLAGLLGAEDVVTLTGELGAGKTVFVRGLCEALAVPREAGVSSPTFALVNLYDGGRIPLAHVDLYRVSDDDELEALGWRDLLAGERALLVEWPERAPSVREVETVAITLVDRGPSRRDVTISLLAPEAATALARSHPAGRVAP